MKQNVMKIFRFKTCTECCHTHTKSNNCLKLFAILIRIFCFAFMNYCFSFLVFIVCSKTIIKKRKLDLVTTKKEMPIHIESEIVVAPWFNSNDQKSDNNDNFLIELTHGLDSVDLFMFVASNIYINYNVNEFDSYVTCYELFVISH